MEGETVCEHSEGGGEGVSGGGDSASIVREEVGE